MNKLLKKLKLNSIPLPLNCLKLNHMQWDLMTYHTKLFLMLFAVCFGMTLVLLIILLLT